MCHQPHELRGVRARGRREELRDDVAGDHDVVTERLRLPREDIRPVIDEALKQAGVRLSQIGCVAVHNTPGLVGALLVGGASYAATGRP